MTRSHYLAVIVGLIAIGGLLAVNLGGSDDITATATSDQANPGSDTATDTSATDTEAQPTTTAAPLAEAPPVLGEASDLIDLDGWLQTDNTQFSDFDGV